VRIRVNDSAGVFLFAAREPEAEELLRAGLAKPLGRPGKKVRCLQLACSRKQAHTFLRGGRYFGQASKTFRLERVGDKRLPLFQHQVERCLEFRPEVRVTTAPAEAAVSFTTGTRTEPVTSCEQLPAIDNSCQQAENEIAVHPEERGSDAEKEEEEACSPAELKASRLCEARCNEQPQCSTHAEIFLELDPLDITGHRRLGQAVILQAIEDNATEWFFASYSRQSFDFWCSVAGLDPGQVRKRATQYQRSKRGQGRNERAA
jgi:hypothetical protein